MQDDMVYRGLIERDRAIERAIHVCHEIQTDLLFVFLERQESAV